MKKFVALSFTFVLLAATVTSSHVFAASINYNNLIDDAVFDDSGSMTAGQINTFLNKFPNSCISTNNGFSAPNLTGYSASTGDYHYGEHASAGTIIHKAAQAYGINPQVILATLQKEQGLVVGDGANVVRNSKRPGDCGALAISASMGYNCPDSLKLTSYSGFTLYAYKGKAVTSVNKTCVEHASYVGFSRQVILASWQLTFDRHRSEGLNNWYVDKNIGNETWDNSDDLNFCYSGHMEKGGPFALCPDQDSPPPAVNYSGKYNICDDSKTCKVVTIQNGATAALYNYTPHLHGQSLFFGDFTSWFGPSTLKDYYSFERLSGSNPAILPVSSSSLGEYTASLSQGSNLYNFYYDATNDNLHIAKFNGSKWTGSILDGKGSTKSGSTSDDVGEYVEAMVYHDHLQLFYYDATGGNLRHAWFDSAGWHFQTFDGTSGSQGSLNKNVGKDPAMTVYHDHLQLFYYDSTDGNLRHAWFDSAGWHFQTFDGQTNSHGGINGVVGQDPDLTVYHDHLQLFYYNATGGNLRHAWFDSAGWHFQTFAGTGSSHGGISSNVGQDPAVTVYHDHLQLFYYDSTDGNLRHAWFDSAGWHLQTFDGQTNSHGGMSGNVGSKAVVKVFQNDMFVYYYDSTRDTWRIAYSDSKWHVFDLDGADGSIADSTTPVGGQLSATVLQGNKLRMFYQDSSGGLAYSWITR